MANEMFFLQLITEALRQPDPKQALRQAFEQIHRLGQQPDHEVGYRQFLRFMEATHTAFREGSFDEEDYPVLVEPASAMVVELVLDRDNKEVGRRRFSRDVRIQSWPDLRPGHYRLSIASGRVVWEEVLTQGDLIWGQAFPGRSLPMAADTGGPERQSSRRVRLPDSGVEVAVFPGLETGVLEVALLSMRPGEL